MSTLPVYIYTGKKNLLNNQDFYPSSANNNEVVIKDFASS